MHPSIRSKGWSQETAAHCVIFVGGISQDIAQKRNNEKSGEYRPRQARYEFFAFGDVDIFSTKGKILKVSPLVDQTSLAAGIFLIAAAKSQFHHQRSTKGGNFRLSDGPRIEIRIDIGSGRYRPCRIDPLMGWQDLDSTAERRRWLGALEIEDWPKLK